ncbi:hypothetical protein [Vitiosangium sp. GDMCC 1.1324]|uniref:hypothetical protein n=1 Tax=Vitiosangium sp. (strain GDMCC 1.1324) TaxID=2138576 RepID=UPI00130E9002|nr:hypothetical protein [Vitiosangium sp. GDMCC 1.1324]
MRTIERLEKELVDAIGTGRAYWAWQEFRDEVERHTELVISELATARRQRQESDASFLAAHRRVLNLDHQISSKMTQVATEAATLRKRYRDAGLDYEDYLRGVQRLERTAGVDGLREKKRQELDKYSGETKGEMAAQERLELLERARSRLPFYERIVAMNTKVSRTCLNDWGLILEEERGFADRLASLLLAVLYSNAHSANTSEKNYRHEVDMDTVAVTVVGLELFVACNFKRRDFRGHYTGFGFSKQDCETLANVIEAEGLEVDRMHFLVPSPMPSDEIENAKPHAEMQLLAHVGRDAMRGQRVGVSKACCINCMAELDRAGVSYPYFAGSFASITMNWDPPAGIRTRILHSVAWD